MKIKIHSRAILISLISLPVFLLSGCVSPGKNTLPQGGDMTMSQIYEKETGLAGQGTAEDQGAIGISDLRKKICASGISNAKAFKFESVTVRSSNEIKQLFGTLPNPQIPIFIYPHLVYTSDEAEPVPGYTTGFFLYKQNHFAMPSEGI